MGGSRALEGCRGGPDPRDCKVDASAPGVGLAAVPSNVHFVLEARRFCSGGLSRNSQCGGREVPTEALWSVDSVITSSWRRRVSVCWRAV